MGRVATFISVASMGLLGLYVGAVIVNVFCRYVLAFSLPMISDLGEVILPSALILTFIVAAINGSFLAITFLGDSFVPRLGRALDLLGRLAIVGLFALFAWQMFRYAQVTFGSGRTTRMMEILIWPVWGLTSVALAVAAVMALIAPRSREGNPKHD